MVFLSGCVRFYTWCYQEWMLCVRVCVCVREWVGVCVCVSLDKTVNPQATRTQYPVCPFLISCLSLAEWGSSGEGVAGDSGTRCPRNRRYSRSIWEKSTPISLSLPLWCDPLFSLSFFLSLSAFIISDLIKPRRAACSAMKHLLAVCYKIVVGEERWWGLISHYAKTVAISPPSSLTCTQTKICPSLRLDPHLKLSDTPSLPSLSHFERLLHQWDSSPMFSHLYHNISPVPAFLPSGTPPTIICWAAGLAHVRLLGKRGVFERFRTTCVHYV